MPNVYVVAAEPAFGLLLVVEAWLSSEERHRPCRLLVDTGAMHTALLPEIVRELDLPHVGESRSIFRVELLLCPLGVYSLDGLTLVGQEIS